MRLFLVEAHSFMKSFLIDTEVNAQAIIPFVKNRFLVAFARVFFRIGKPLVLTTNVIQSTELQRNLTAHRLSANAFAVSKLLNCFGKEYIQMFLLLAMQCVLVAVEKE